MTEYLLYGLPHGQTERYTELLLIATTDRAIIDRVRGLAERDGFHSFREVTYSGEAPDFSKTINV